MLDEEVINSLIKSIGLKMKFKEQFYKLFPDKKEAAKEEAAVATNLSVSSGTSSSCAAENVCESDANSSDTQNETSIKNRSQGPSTAFLGKSQKSMV